MKNHILKMLLGCGGAFLLLFLLPVLGFGQGTTFVVFIVAMLACHIFMMGGHAHGDHGQSDEKQCRAHDHGTETHARAHSKSASDSVYQRVVK